MSPRIIRTSQFLTREALLTVSAEYHILKLTELQLSNNFIVNNLVWLMYRKS